MRYVEILVGEASYHGQEALTYSTEEQVLPGQLVKVAIRTKLVLGIVIASSDEAPAFKVKPIMEVVQLPILPPELIATLEWMRDFYPSPLGVITQQFLPTKLPAKPLGLFSYKEIGAPQLPPLTADQEAALRSMQGPGLYLLHGDTGTGKTRVYIEMALRSLENSRSSIILTPEIGLTSQLANDFRQVFGDRVIVIHSQLTDATRQKLWVRILRETEPVIVLGPRSALFTPLHDVGFIAIDEAHENAYKQDQAPYYHASRVASKLAELHKASIILGSATPLVTDHYIAEAKKRPIIRMQQTAATTESSASSVQVIDLKDYSHFTRKPYISNELIQATQDTLARHEQVLLFLNRRGTARVVFCEKCGWQAACPHCDIPLVYHGDLHQMRCHTCDFKVAPPGSCPECHNPSIVFKSIGTKAITESIQTLFPEARIQRFDTDNKKEERIENHYQAVRDGEIDIIIGTQTLAKGLDLPKLGLVGVIIADTSLYFPDFSAQERTYQLLSQVLGRVGRGHRASQAIVQTYSPDSPLLQSVLEKDWQSFYKQELLERKIFLFPPFCYILKLTCRRASQASAQNTAQGYAQILRQSGRRIVVEGPAPAFHEKVQNKYAWQLIIKTKDRSQLTDVIRSLPSGWSYDIDPLNLL